MTDMQLGVAIWWILWMACCAVSLIAALTGDYFTLGLAGLMALALTFWAYRDDRI